MFDLDLLLKGQTLHGQKPGELGCIFGRCRSKGHTHHDTGELHAADLKEVEVRLLAEKIRRHRQMVRLHRRPRTGESRNARRARKANTRKHMAGEPVDGVSPLRDICYDLSRIASALSPMAQSMRENMRRYDL